MMAYSQQQTEFVIGAEWLKYPTIDGLPPPQGSLPMTAQDWNNVKDLGLNWGMLSLDKYNNTIVTDALNAARANGIKIILERFRTGESGCPGSETPGYYLGRYAWGNRWRYQPEYAAHYPDTGMTGELTNDNNAQKDADDINNTNNSRRAVVGTHSMGYMVKNLTPKTEQEDNVTYYLKVRLRLASGSFTHDSVVTVRAVVGSSNRERTIYADECPSGMETNGFGKANPAATWLDES